MNTPLLQQGDRVLRLAHDNAEAERMADTQVLAEACSHVGVGMATVQGSDRSADVVRLRATVVWLLRRSFGLSARRVGVVINRTERQARKLTRLAENKS